MQIAGHGTWRIMREVPLINVHQFAREANKFTTTVSHVNVSVHMYWGDVTILSGQRIQKRIKLIREHRADDLQYTHELDDV